MRLAALGLLLALSACKKAEEPAATATPVKMSLGMPAPQPIGSVKGGGTSVESVESPPAPTRREPAGATAQEIDSAAKDGVAFALAFRAALKEPGNQFFSPYSVTSALALLRLGASGKTAAEITSALRSSLPGERLHPAMADLQAAILDQLGAQVSAVSALWPSGTLKMEPTFLESARRFYDARPEPLDYSVPDDAAKRINAWVERGTNGKIRDLVSASMFDRETLLVLANAVYFKGSWLEAFEKGATQPAPFTRSKGSPVQAQLMTAIREVPYLDAGSLQVAELPYRGDRFSMVILLPKAAKGLRALETSLTQREVDGWLGRLAPRKVELLIPRFKLEISLDLKPVLQDMGLRLAFENIADFSSLSRTRPVKIDAAVHKAFVDVNEEGTEAAAATAILMGPGSAAVSESPPLFRADHPFLFLIRDRRTGAILFLGRLEDPA